jgi:hypothetical protein
MGDRIMSKITGPLTREELNEKHRWSPEPGDMWDERCMYVAIVLDVRDSWVTICRDRKTVDEDHWTWDLDKVKTITIEQFASIFLYHGHEVNMVGANCWADVNPRKGLQFAQEWKRTTTPKTPVRDNYR